MHELQLRDAKATLSAVIDQACAGRPSLITRHGRPAAVVLSYVEWERLSRVPSFGCLLMNLPATDEVLFERETGSLREADL